MSSHNDDSAPAVSGFLAKTFDIFSDPANYDLCSWGPGGDTIIVKKIDDFSKIILPRHFKHSNFQSFVRQLNMYDFHKTVADPSNGQFQHVFFLQGRRDLLHLIKRKAHNHKPVAPGAAGGEATSGGSKKQSTSTSAQVGAQHAVQAASVSSLEPAVPLLADGAPLDAAQQKVLKTDLERRIREVEKQNNRIKDLEASQAKIVRENIQLSRLLNDTRIKQQLMSDKMEKVLKILYCLYTKQPLSRILNGGDISRLPSIPESGFAEICNYLQVDYPFGKKNSLIEDSVSMHPDLGSPIVRGGSFDIAASSVVPPFGGELMSFPSFNGANGDGLGKPLGRMHSLDPYAYPPTWTAAASPEPPADGPLNDFLSRVSHANAVPLLEDAPSNGPDKLTGFKREFSQDDHFSDNKKIKSEDMPAPVTGLGTPLGDPLTKSNSSFFSDAVSNLLQNNPDISLQRLDSLEAHLTSLMDGDDALKEPS